MALGAVLWVQLGPITAHGYIYEAADGQPSWVAPGRLQWQTQAHLQPRNGHELCVTGDSLEGMASRKRTGYT